MNICIYGSASKNLNPLFIEECTRLGKEIARRGHGIVFGGSTNGLMGATATAVAKSGGEVLGIAPRFMDEGTYYDKCTDFIYTETMSERKDLFVINADAFIILPGGIGTLDEFFETLVYKSLGKQNKPIALFNIDGYYDKLEDFMKVASQEGFMRMHEKQLYHIAKTCDKVLDLIESE